MHSRRSVAKANGIKFVFTFDTAPRRSESGTSLTLEKVSRVGKRTLTRFGTTTSSLSFSERREGERDVIALRRLLWRILILDSRGQERIKVRFLVFFSIDPKDGRIRFSLLESINSERNCIASESDRR